MAALPIADGPLAMIDGKRKGCRVLHSVFAAVNDKHCAHISYEPEVDSEGLVKCQISAPDDAARLDEDDIAAYDAYLESHKI